MNNPAAMVDFDTYAVQIDATAINVSTQFHGSGTDAIGRPLSGSDGGNGGGVHGVPAISFIAPIAENWRLGFGVNAPFDKTWTCMEEGSDPCWACRLCRAREQAFHQAAKPDPLRVVKKV